MQTTTRQKRERETPKRIAFKPQNKNEKPKPTRRNYISHKKPRTVIHPRVIALEKGMDHYMWAGKAIHLYCPDCGELLAYRKSANFSLQCRTADCLFIGYSHGVPVREAISRRVLKAEKMKKRWAEPGYRERQAKISRERWERPGYRERSVENMKKRWEDPEYRAEMTEARKKRCADPEYRERVSERMIEHWKDPSFREKTILGHKMAIQARNSQ